MIFFICVYLEYGIVRNYVCSRGIGMWYIFFVSLIVVVVLVDRGRCVILSICCFFFVLGYFLKWSLLSKGVFWKGEGVNSSRVFFYKRGIVSGCMFYFFFFGRIILRCILYGFLRFIL